MKFYPCIVISRDELADAGIPEIRFENGRLADPAVTDVLEDYCGRPIVAVRESTRPEDDVFAITADGYIQYNRISNKRTAVLTGNFDSLKVVLTDIFNEYPRTDPDKIFCAYAYQTDVIVQLDLQEWVRTEYRPKWVEWMNANHYEIK